MYAVYVFKLTRIMTNTGIDFVCYRVWKPNQKCMTAFSRTNLSCIPSLRRRTRPIRISHTHTHIVGFLRDHRRSPADVAQKRVLFVPFQCSFDCVYVWMCDATKQSITHTYFLCFLFFSLCFLVFINQHTPLIISNCICFSPSLRSVNMKVE